LPERLVYRPEATISMVSRAISAALLLLWDMPSSV
jgi:hypothetical protein